MFVASAATAAAAPSRPLMLCTRRALSALTSTPSAEEAARILARARAVAREISAPSTSPQRTNPRSSRVGGRPSESPASARPEATGAIRKNIKADSGGSSRAGGASAHLFGRGAAETRLGEGEGGADAANATGGPSLEVGVGGGRGDSAPVGASAAVTPNGSPPAAPYASAQEASSGLSAALGPWWRQSTPPSPSAPSSSPSASAYSSSSSSSTFTQKLPMSSAPRVAAAFDRLAPGQERALHPAADALARMSERQPTALLAFLTLPHAIRAAQRMVEEAEAQRQEVGPPTRRAGRPAGRPAALPHQQSGTKDDRAGGEQHAAAGGDAAPAAASGLTAEHAGILDALSLAVSRLARGVGALSASQPVWFDEGLRIDDQDAAREALTSSWLSLLGSAGRLAEARAHVQELAELGRAPELVEVRGLMRAAARSGDFGSAAALYLCAPDVGMTSAHISELCGDMVDVAIEAARKGKGRALVEALDAAAAAPGGGINEDRVGMMSDAGAVESAGDNKEGGPADGGEFVDEDGVGFGAAGARGRDDNILAQLAQLEGMDPLSASASSSRQRGGGGDAAGGGVGDASSSGGRGSSGELTAAEAAREASLARLATAMLRLRASDRGEPSDLADGESALRVAERTYANLGAALRVVSALAESDPTGAVFSFLWRMRLRLAALLHLERRMEPLGVVVGGTGRGEGARASSRSFSGGAGAGWGLLESLRGGPSAVARQFDLRLSRLASALSGRAVGSAPGALSNRDRRGGNDGEVLAASEAAVQAGAGAGSAAQGPAFNHGAGPGAGGDINGSLFASGGASGSSSSSQSSSQSSLSSLSSTTGQQLHVAMEADAAAAQLSGMASAASLAASDTLREAVRPAIAMFEVDGAAGLPGSAASRARALLAERAVLLLRTQASMGLAPEGAAVSLAVQCALQARQPAIVREILQSFGTECLPPASAARLAQDLGAFAKRPLYAAALLASLPALVAAGVKPRAPVVADLLRTATEAWAAGQAVSCPSCSGSGVLVHTHEVPDGVAAPSLSGVLHTHIAAAPLTRSAKNRLTGERAAAATTSRMMSTLSSSFPASALPPGGDESDAEDGFVGGVGVVGRVAERSSGGDSSQHSVSLDTLGGPWEGIAKGRAAARRAAASRAFPSWGFPSAASAAYGGGGPRSAAGFGAAWGGGGGGGGLLPNASSEILLRALARAGVLQPHAGAGQGLGLDMGGVWGNDPSSFASFAASSSPSSSAAVAWAPVTVDTSVRCAGARDHNPRLAEEWPLYPSRALAIVSSLGLLEAPMSGGGAGLSSALAPGTAAPAVSPEIAAALESMGRATARARCGREAWAVWSVLRSLRLPGALERGPLVQGMLGAFLAGGLRLPAWEAYLTLFPRPAPGPLPGLASMAAQLSALEKADDAAIAARGAAAIARAAKKEMDGGRGQAVKSVAPYPAPGRREGLPDEGRQEQQKQKQQQRQPAQQAPGLARPSSPAASAAASLASSGGPATAEELQHLTQQLMRMLEAEKSARKDRESESARQEAVMRGLQAQLASLAALVGKPAPQPPEAMAPAKTPAGAPATAASAPSKTTHDSRAPVKASAAAAAAPAASAKAAAASSAKMAAAASGLAKAAASAAFPPSPATPVIAAVPPTPSEPSASLSGGPLVRKTDVATWSVWHAKHGVVAGVSTSPVVLCAVPAGVAGGMTLARERASPWRFALMSALSLALRTSHDPDVRACRVATVDMGLQMLRDSHQEMAASAAAAVAEGGGGGGGGGGGAPATVHIAVMLTMRLPQGGGGPSSPPSPAVGPLDGLASVAALAPVVSAIHTELRRHAAHFERTLAAARRHLLEAYPTLLVPLDAAGRAAAELGGGGGGAGKAGPGSRGGGGRQSSAPAALPLDERAAAEAVLTRMQRDAATSADALRVSLASPVFVVVGGAEDKGAAASAATAVIAQPRNAPDQRVYVQMTKEAATGRDSRGRRG